MLRPSGVLVPHLIITVTFADGACEARSRQEEEDDAWPSSTTTNAEIVHNPHLPFGWRRDGPMALSLLLSIRKGMASSSLRALDTVTLATNVTVIMKCGTKGPRRNNLVELALGFAPDLAAND